MEQRLNRRSAQTGAEAWPVLHPSGFQYTSRYRHEQLQTDIGAVCWYLMLSTYSISRMQMHGHFMSTWRYIIEGSYPDESALSEFPSIKILPSSPIEMTY